MKTTEYKSCRLCARLCGVDRTNGRHGYCGAGDTAYISRISLHMWEEPIISGTNGSGTVFFSGCSLGCVYCQNREISRRECGKPFTVEELVGKMHILSKRGAHNVNFVTPTHYMPSVREAIKIARREGLLIPTVYNTASYDTVEALASLDGIMDIYLADFKYYLPKTAKEYSFAENYPEASRLAINEMVRQQPKPVIENGLMKKGVIVRILLLPNHVSEAKLSLKYLYDTYGDSIYISLMNQYTPMPQMKPPLNRSVTHSEYEQLVSYAESFGVKNAFIQEYGTDKDSFIPDFSEGHNGNLI